MKLTANPVTMTCNYKIIFGFALIISFAQADAQDKTSKSEPDIYNQNETYERKVIFQEMWNDYLIFYDAQKNIYYLKYRKDKWDYANDELANQFVQGIEYIISFQFIKTIHNAHELLNMPDSSRDLPDGEEARKIRDKKVFVVGVYKLHKQSMNIRF